MRPRYTLRSRISADSSASAASPRARSTAITSSASDSPIPRSIALSMSTSGPRSPRTSQKPDCTQEMLSCSPSGTVMCSTAPVSSRCIHCWPPTSSASPARYPCMTGSPTTSKSRPSHQASTATWKFGRSHAASARETIGRSRGSWPKCSRSSRRTADSGSGACSCAHSVSRLSAPASSSGSTDGILPQDQRASWKMIPSAVRLPSRTVLTPWRSPTRW